MKKGLRNSVADRIKVTKNGKMLHRSAANSHAKTRKSNNNLNSKKRKKKLDYPKAKVINY